MEDKILDRIKKLFALAGNNSNQNEADSAMKMAKKMLDKHNLSVYDLKEKDDVGIKIEDNVNMPWTRTIYSAISKLYDVKYIMDKTSKPMKHLLVGTESNRVTASIVIAFVISEVRGNCQGMGNGYRNAAADGVDTQVMDILAERNKSHEEIIPGTGLVPMDATRMAFEDINDWVKNHMGNLSSSKANSGAYDNRGFAMGNGINLGAHLSNKRALN